METCTANPRVPINSNQLVKLHFPNVSDLQMLETYFEVTSEIMC